MAVVAVGSTGVAVGGIGATTAGVSTALLAASLGAEADGAGSLETAIGGAVNSVRVSSLGA